ncbi:unnamed protein product [Bursaphelenchus xylophilus]|uniref:[heparan sulfate]-glucosamine N-sulfotransferase n=1 Tax=Bursaphelenchus xylophilus TaxID=6326 RepID=A0A1I7RHT0_BURXY|nr:unnamed protein product [Bursaphelenchus xylophilus]CAG9115418.1 unnamed protein product [Bursaphelenchus xylophilus]
MLHFRRYLHRILFLLVFFVLSYFLYPRTQNVRRLRYPAVPQDGFSCPSNYISNVSAVDLTPKWSRETARVLVIGLKNDKLEKRAIINSLDYLKIPVFVENIEEISGLLLEFTSGILYEVIIFTDLNIFYSLSAEDKVLLENACSKYKIGIISFTKRTGSYHDIDVVQVVKPVNFKFIDGNFTRIAKVGTKIPELLPDISAWYRIDIKQGWSSVIVAEDKNGTSINVAVRRDSPFDHVVIGHNLTNWVTKVAFLDALSFLLGEKWTGGNERFIQIDIDDVFVGQVGTRIVKEDVTRLIKAQKTWRDSFIDGFTFTLGFSGSFFGRGTSEELDGDEELLKQAHHFLWFPHMWKHNHAHEYSYDNLTSLMDLNKQFALSNGLNVSLNYAVSPQHTGVYPIHQPLYKAWKEIWNVKVTSTEEYPHFQPSSKRRGFAFNGIRVLPRQTCGLYTHTMYFHALPNGFKAFKDNIEGGSVFNDILFNQFNIFMTHQQNWGNDRLAIYLFENTFTFIKCFTNLRLKWIPPTEMAVRYFKRTGSSESLLYTDECSDKRHVQGLSYLRKCDNSSTLPNLLILGPQKTGTTALAEFLKIHANVSSNIDVIGSFEEPQFFGQNNYLKGVNWYKKLFNQGQKVVFEKSANYFDNPKVAEQVFHLLPKSKFIVILMDPVDRAYSWYQHMKAHNDSIASQFNLSYILKEKNDNSIKRLRRRCLNPGEYAVHLHRWLELFNFDQFIFIDGKQLKEEPSKVMNQLLRDLHLPFMDYRRILKYNEKKGYFCIDFKDKTKCLGSSKGRKYDKMDEETRNLLENEFRYHNRDLKLLLTHFKSKLPYFLK